MSDKMKIVAIISVCVIIVSSIVVLNIYTNEHEEQIPPQLPKEYITALEGYEKAEKLAKEWRKDATFCGGGSNETINGTSKMWKYNFYSPSSMNFWNESVPQVGGGTTIVEFVEYEWLEVRVYADGRVNSTPRIANTSRFPSEIELIIDSDEVYRISIKNESIMEHIGDRKVESSIYFRKWQNHSVISVYLKPFPTDKYVPEMYVCFVDAKNGKIVNIWFYG